MKKRNLRKTLRIKSNYRKARAFGYKNYKAMKKAQNRYNSY